MARACTTCQHLKRPEIDRRLAAGEPSAQVARDYDLNASSLHRHRRNCLRLGSSNAIKKDAARGSAATALLPSKETLSGAYFDLRGQIDQIVTQATQQGSLSVAISGLNSIRHTLDSLARLAGHDRAGGTEVNVALQTHVQLDLNQIAERLIEQFDHEPDVKARIAQALLSMEQTPKAKPEIAASVPPPMEPPTPDTGATGSTANVGRTACGIAPAADPTPSPCRPVLAMDIPPAEHATVLARPADEPGGVP